MMKRTYFILITVTLIVFIQCKREPLQINPNVTDLSDFESNDGKIALNISGGKAPYSVLWSNNATDSVLSSLGSGISYVTVTDARSAVVIDTIEVKQPEWPICIDIDGNSYKTAVIGNSIWMIENLRLTKTSEGDSIESLVYDNIEENAAIYGRLYTWPAVMNNSTSEQAQGICPDDWHVPSNEEWNTLIDNISTADKEIPNIKSSLDLAYAGFYNNGFNNLDASVSFWTSTEAGDNALKVYFHKSLSKAFSYHEKKSNAISVRCVKN
jgi:uncharacterized protein (TIGR02145 family)